MKRLVILFFLLFPLAANAKQKPKPVVEAPKRAEKIDREYMFEAQLLDKQLAEAEAQKQAVIARIVDWRARVSKLYGVNFDANDEINVVTGEIKWHPVEVKKDEKK